jgi:hypothetical protein
MYHIKENGEPGICSAKQGNCPLGGEHFVTFTEARRSFEDSMSSSLTEAFKKAPTLDYSRSEFFSSKNAGNYTLIDVPSGTVFSDNCVVLEYPEDLDEVEQEEFLDDPSEYLSREDVKSDLLQEAKTYHPTKILSLWK